MPSRTQPHLSPTVASFDALPDSAILRQPDLETLLGVGSSTVWRLVNSGALPRVKVSPRCTGWRVGDVRAYLASRNPGA